MIDAAGRDIVIEVDGGVTPQTAPDCVAAGAHGAGGRHRGVQRRPGRLRRQHPRAEGRLTGSLTAMAEGAAPDRFACRRPPSPRWDGGCGASGARRRCTAWR